MTADEGSAWQSRLPPASRRPEGLEPEAPAIRDWLHIEQDGAVTVYTGKVEVGQHIRTSLAQAVAEELRLPVAAIRLVMADTDRTPFDMGTVGSRTTPVMAQRLRLVAATTRELLLDLAAVRLGVARDELVIGGGQVRHPPSGRACGFGELTQGRRLTQEWDEQAPLTPPERWTVAGAPVASVGGEAFVTGAHHYTPDLSLPGALVGAVLRPPAFGAQLVSLDLEAARLPGVVVVHEGDFVGVAAPDRRTALLARDAIRAEWRMPAPVSSAGLYDYLRAHPAPPDPQRWPPPVHHEQGDVEAA
ncbi:MAG TPA: molybdopterin cofactor-binding domain-containing protein, partial [Roseiflexaceae bacterium]|nr:molybdopterin cofactor-binding domain-containing protein [Roseiflexaceae bacterium]